MKQKRRRALAALSMLGMALAWADCTGAQAHESDEDKIIRQIQDHHYLWDSRDLESWSALFTADAVTHSYARGKTEPVWTSLDLETLLKASRHFLASREGIQSRHHPSGIQFLELTDTTAITRHTVLVTLQEEGKAAPTLSASGTYTMHWVKIDREWRIRQRDFYRD